MFWRFQAIMVNGFVRLLGEITSLDANFIRRKVRYLD